jgi:Flp pilus assembly pilin Flp
LELRLLLKRGGLLAAANWPVVAIQFVAQTTFQALLAVPVIGAAILVAVLLGGDLGNLLQGSMREIFTTIADALMSEPIALVAFMAAFGIVLVGGSVLMFLIKGGVVDVMLAADAQAGPIEHEALTLGNLRHGSCFAVERFVAACARLFRRYLVLGVALMITYVVSGAAYLAFVIYGYRTLGAGGFVIEWTLIAALSAVALVLWITSVNLIYLLLQIVTAIDDLAFGQAVRAVVRFIRSEFVELGGVFLVVFGMVIGATFASALAWSGVGLIAFVPLVGLAVFPLQIAALILRGLVFEYIGLTAMGAYITLYRQYAARADVTHGITASSVARSVSAG